MKKSNIQMAARTARALVPVSLGAVAGAWSGDPVSWLVVAFVQLCLAVALSFAAARVQPKRRPVVMVDLAPKSMRVPEDRLR